MAKFLSIILVGLFFKILVFEPSTLIAENLSFSSISVEGNKRLSDEAIVNYSRLVTGSIISSEDLNDAYRKIVSTGLFKNVSFKQSNQKLVISVTEYPTVNEISFEGNKKFTDEKLSSFIETKSRFVLAPNTLENDVAELQKVYKNSGRILARIQPKVINLSDNRVNVVFEVYEGSVVEIETINFVGNRTFSDRKLRGVLRTKQASVFRKIIQKDNLIDERISLDKKLLTEFYKNRGFADFRINNVNAELSEERDGFFITYNITEGPQFSLGKIDFISAVKELNASNFTSFSNLKSGEVYSPTDVKSNISKLEENLQAVGFEFIRVRPTVIRNMSNLTIDLKFVFEQSDKLFIERIDISGNTATLDRVVRRQFFIVEGDPFNSREIKAAADRIRSLGLFSDSFVKVLPGSRESLVVIDVKVIEKPTGSLTFGAGYSSEAGLGGLIEYGEKNFLGRGQALSFAINTGKDDQLYELSFYEPMFLRNDLGLGINLSAKDTQRQNAAYDTDSLNFGPYIVFPVGEKSNLKFQYSLEKTNLSNPGDVGSIILNEVNEGSITSSSMGYVFSYDSRVFKNNSQNGFAFKLGQQFTGLGGDKTAFKTTIKAAAQINTFKNDLKLSAEFEAGILTYTEGNSRVIDRFFLNSRKMRGFEPGGVGPRECLNGECGVSNNDALGGENFAVVRFEAEFPLGLPDEYGLTGGLFYDVGNLWSLRKINNDVLYEDGAWRQSIGASLFWRTPIGPLRFNFSDVLKKEVFDRDESFDLTISTRF
jgi:outer membrane protein insertion porin family